MLDPEKLALLAAAVQEKKAAADAAASALQTAAAAQTALNGQHRSQHDEVDKRFGPQFRQVNAAREQAHAAHEQALADLATARQAVQDFISPPPAPAAVPASS